MTTTNQIIVTEALRYGWMLETKQSWIDLKVDEDNTLRLTFPDDFPPDIKLCLQTLQRHVAEERRKAGLPAIESTYLEAVERLEYGHDDVNQIALIRVRFRNGGSQDTPIEKNQIQQTIEFLTSTLLDFKNQSQSRTH